MTMNPHITAALAGELRKTLITQAEAARIVREARGHRRQECAPAGRTSRLRWLKLVAVGPHLNRYRSCR